MPKDFKHRSHGGPGLRAILYDSSGEKILGQGTNLNWQDDFEIYPVEEWGTTGIDEFVPGKMRGSGSIGTLCIADINDNLPRRGNFVNAGPFTIQEIVADGRPNAGTIINQFEEVWLTVHSGNFGATGLAAKNVNFVYGKRTPGAEIQGISYPA